MTHYVCKGNCQATTQEQAICETEGCANQWQMLEACECSDGMHGIKEELMVADANGNQLKDGDSVALIKDLPLRGTSRVIKIGTKVSNIRVTDNPEEVDCKIGGTAIVLRTEFLKKL